MSLFAIGDLHLCIGVPEKTMNIFSGWNNYMELIEKNWTELIKPDDTVLICGDVSWGMTLEQAEQDFAFIDRLAGKKIILKGNHDYWWTSRKKMEDFFKVKSFSTLDILHNNCFGYEKYGICGTRGWVSINGETADEKVLKREVQRLETSVTLAESQGLEPLVFLHYPPIYANTCNYDILDVLYRHNIKRCYYGHLHGSSHRYTINGERDGVDFQLISGDFLQFRPLKIV